jgi:hypothetical protein
MHRQQLATPERLLWTGMPLLRIAVEVPTEAKIQTNFHELGKRPTLGYDNMPSACVS